ncbi:MAG: cache domain-containing protein [Deltaproteobacteria bacterium]|nr:cache domain-containing protein [Deltaproteobacteria bacterium]
MNITLKQNMLFMVGIMTLCSLLGYVVLIHNAHRIGINLKRETQQHIQSLVGKNAQRIASAMALMEKNADDLATAGEAFYTIFKETDIDPTEIIKTYLIRNFQKLPEAVGGGLWYEPFTILDKPHYGLYTYRENDQVLFTWDLNTPQYDYPSQDWYRLAIPKEWNRSEERGQQIYWTDPYLDEAATQALMITVDALMTDPKNGIIGISTVDFSLEDLKRRIARMTITPNSLPFAVDISSGLLIAYPADPKRLLQPISEMNWGTALEPLDGLAPGEVIETSLTINGSRFSLSVQPPALVSPSASSPRTKSFMPASTTSTGPTSSYPLGSSRFRSFSSCWSPSSW